MRILVLLFSLVLLIAAPASALAAPSVAVRPVSFTVTNPLELGALRTVRGSLYLPANNTQCRKSVMLLIPGLSYGAWAWDFPFEPDTYSVARALASQGFPAIAIDKLGYGASDHPNGYTLTVESYAAMTSQIVTQLRTGLYQTPLPSLPLAFSRVGLMGHSAGTEIAELTAALFGGVDVLIATGYTHVPTPRILTDFTTGDSVRAALSDHVYFGGTVEQRTEYMYNLAAADPAVVALDTAMAELTPSGEILTISSQPSRLVMPLITAPVLLVLAEQDILFPPSLLGVPVGELELALFTLSSDKALHVVPGAGHSFMLHTNAPETNAVIVDWLSERVPACQASVGLPLLF
ncbi:alpha/beta hydrolase [Polyangium sorediatum]|uniref:Alpha/beta hydrolase n=1 Tax=Polyangium sorediatum TaxID=889274 RepID=A0ABT6P8H9_9BACT|nr:alpha/beta hydrolase [Polyangium sorediatum]MDI1436920.1 alpha/beta hydrolase [Polyangium sorediatum]